MSFLACVASVSSRVMARKLQREQKKKKGGRGRGRGEEERHSLRSKRFRASSSGKVGTRVKKRNDRGGGGERRL